MTAIGMDELGQAAWPTSALVEALVEVPVCCLSQNGVRVSLCTPQAKEKKPHAVLYVEIFKKAVPVWAAGAKPEETPIEPGSMEALAAVRFSIFLAW